MESNEREKADPDGSTSSSYFAMIKISPRTRSEIPGPDRGGDETGRRWRETNAGATCTAVRDGDVRTYERTKVGLSYDSVCSRGPALDPAKRIFFLFFISSSAAPP